MSTIYSTERTFSKYLRLPLITTNNIMVRKSEVKPKEEGDYESKSNSYY